MDAAVLGDFVQEPLAVRAAQLLDLAVAEQGHDELGPLILQLRQRLRVGGVAGLRLLDPLRTEALLVEQQRAQLGGRVEVELVVARDPPQLGCEGLDLGREAHANGPSSRETGVV